MAQIDSFEASRTNGPHHFLARFVGQWRGITKTYFEPGTLADESEWNGTIRPVLSGMFLLYEYIGSINGKPLSGTALYGYNIGTGSYESCWTDSFHNGTSMMISRGPVIPEIFSVLGSYPAPDNSPPWGWRTVIQAIDPNTLRIEMFNITPTGEEALAVETLYRRVTEAT